MRGTLTAVFRQPSTHSAKYANQPNFQKIAAKEKGQVQF